MSDGPARPEGLVVTPTPTDEELAAILAAYEALWPAPHAGLPAPPTTPRWRFAGRWWHPRPAWGGWR